MARPTPLVFDTSEAMALLREARAAERLAQQRLDQALRLETQAERKLLTLNRLIEA